MTELKLITFEGTSPDALYDMSMALGARNLVLVNYRIDIDVSTIYATPATFYANLPKSIDLEVGTTIGAHNVIDTDPKSFYLKVPLESTVETFGSLYVLISYGQPNIGFKMQNDIQRQTKFSIRDSTGALLNSSLLKYFCFQFQAL